MVFLRKNLFSEFGTILYIPFLMEEMKRNFGRKCKCCKIKWRQANAVLTEMSTKISRIDVLSPQRDTAFFSQPRFWWSYTFRCDTLLWSSWSSLWWPGTKFQTWRHQSADLWGAAMGHLDLGVCQFESAKGTVTDLRNFVFIEIANRRSHGDWRVAWS